MVVYSDSWYYSIFRACSQPFGIGVTSHTLGAAGGARAGGMGRSAIVALPHPIVARSLLVTVESSDGCAPPDPVCPPPETLAVTNSARSHDFWGNHWKPQPRSRERLV